MGQENRLTSISWSPTISSINSASGLSALLGTRAAKMAGSSPVYQKPLRRYGNGHDKCLQTKNGNSVVKYLLRAVNKKSRKQYGRTRTSLFCLNTYKCLPLDN